MSLSDRFLTKNENKEIRKQCFQAWGTNADARALVPLLSGRGFLTDSQEQAINLDTRTLNYANNYFFMEILIKLTRNKYIELIHILKDDDKHKVFAHEFANILKVSLTKMAGSTHSDPSEEVREHTMEMDGEAFSAGMNFNGPTVASYGAKEMTKSGEGKGIVFIIANFTQTLEGYKTDIVCITQFFRKKLGYDVHVYQNVTKDELFEALPRMKGLVENGNCDRFYLFVLSHGNENGVLGIDEQVIPVKDIVKPFQHDQMKSMKGFPKLFFIQACRGDNYTKVAGGGHSKMKAQQLIPIEADQMVCYSVTECNVSIVHNKKGSMFIQNVIKGFEKYYNSTEDIGVIMREVKHNIANDRWHYEADGK